MFRNWETSCTCASVRSFHSIHLKRFKIFTNIPWPEDGIHCSCKSCGCSLSSMSSRLMRCTKHNTRPHSRDRSADGIEYSHSSVTLVRSAFVAKYLTRFEMTRLWIRVLETRRRRQIRLTVVVLMRECRITNWCMIHRWLIGRWNIQWWSMSGWMINWWSSWLE